MMWWGARWQCVYIPHLRHHHSSTDISHQTIFPAQHTIPHFTYFNTIRAHITVVRCGIVWCEIWCDVECFAMPEEGCCALFILMWLWCRIRCNVEYVRYGAMLHDVKNKVQCRICAIWCNATCDVKNKVQCRICAIWCDATCAVSDEVLWNVGWWCGAWGIWWCVVMQDVKCGCGIPSDVEWFDAILDMVEMQCRMWCGLECVLWDSVMCNLYFNVAMCTAWCEVQCGRDVE